MPSPTVVIAGGGASGTLLAHALIEGSADARAVILDPNESVGIGVAYATTYPVHLLNVPAGRISAFPDVPAHFREWLDAHYPNRYNAGSFVERSIYGEYLQEIARGLVASGRVTHERSTALRAEMSDSGIHVQTSAGVVDGDYLVLATGNAAPAPWPNAPESDRFFSSAWAEGALHPHYPDETVLMLGTGLTAVDAVLALRHNGHRGIIYMMSRRGLLPHEHRLFDAPPEASPEAENLRDLIASIRELADVSRAEHANWRPAIDRIRPRTNELWQALNQAEQRTFIRHVLPYWNVHRHRMAPEAAKSIAELIAADTLRMIAGRTLSFEVIEGALRVGYRPRGSESEESIVAQRVINCSGPEHDPRKIENPLISSLLAAGTVTPYPLNLGLEIAPDGAVVDADGTASERIFSIGPVRYGTLIETTAIPEIRVQAVELAARILGTDFPERKARARDSAEVQR